MQSVYGGYEDTFLSRSATDIYPTLQYDILMPIYKQNDNLWKLTVLSEKQVLKYYLLYDRIKT